MGQQKMKEILQKEDDLQEIVQLVAKIIREDFLQQNGFTDYDFMCPLAKTIGMMKVIVESSGDSKITWNQIAAAMRDMVKKVTDMKFEMPRQSEEHYKKTFLSLYDEVVAAFRALAEER